MIKCESIRLTAATFCCTWASLSLSYKPASVQTRFKHESMWFTAATCCCTWASLSLSYIPVNVQTHFLTCINAIDWCHLLLHLGQPVLVLQTSKRANANVNRKQCAYNPLTTWASLCLSYTPTTRANTFLGLARTIYTRCVYNIFGREITKSTAIYGVYIRFWPTLHIFKHASMRLTDATSCCLDQPVHVLHANNTS